MGGCTSRIELQDEEGVVWLVLNWRGVYGVFHSSQDAFAFARTCNFTQVVRCAGVHDRVYCVFGGTEYIGSYSNAEMAQETVNLHGNPQSCRIAIVEVVREANPQ